MRHLAIDLDDVVLDFCGGLRDAIRKEYGVTITEDEMTQWDLHPLLDPIIGRSWWSWLREREWLWANFPAIDGAMGGLDTLRRQGFYLECVTSKPAWAEHNVYKWLGKWRPPFHRVTIVGPNHRKADYTDATILIDDKLENLVGFQASSKGRQGIMFSRPHNRNDEFSRRVRDWPELVQLLGTRNGSTD